MTLRELKELIAEFNEADLDLPIKKVMYLNDVNVVLQKANYLGHKSVVIYLED